MYSSMVKSIGSKRAVRCTEVVRFSDGPLLEGLLYSHITVSVSSTYNWTAVRILVDTMRFKTNAALLIGNGIFLI